MSSSTTTPGTLRGLPRPWVAKPRGRLLRWRREQLIAAGYDEFSAYRLAADAGVDIHAMVVDREMSASSGGEVR